MGRLYIIALALTIMFGANILYVKEKQKRAQSAAVQVEENNTPLVGTPWVWLHTELADGDLISTPARENYVLTLDTENTVTSTTDCNTFSGTYTKEEDLLRFSLFTSTKMLCDDSLEVTYSRHLAYVWSYEIHGTTLRAYLSNGGRMVFEKQ